MPVKNAQSVAPSITTKKRTSGVEDWFESMGDYLQGRFGGLFDNASPVGFDVEIEPGQEITKRNIALEKHDTTPPLNECLFSEHTVASYRRWQVPLTYQKVKSAMITSGLLKLEPGRYGKHSHDGYVFTKDLVLMNISEATTIILNAPQATNKWFIEGTDITLQEYLKRCDFMNEQDLEHLAMAWFKQLGYQTLHGPDIEPGGTVQERSEYSK